MAVLVLAQKEYDILNKKIEGKTIRIFVSYSSVDKNLAGIIKSNLEEYSLSVFLAHEDIKPTVDWQNELVHNLRGCDIFMPILTSGFPTSEWTNQEIGFAYALEKTFLPLKVHVNPSGFITRVQALPFDCTYPSYSCSKVIDLIQENPLFKNSLTDCLIRTLEKSHSFDSANYAIVLLRRFENFSSEQANNILRIFIKNNQVRMCATGKEFGPLLITKFDSILDSALKKMFQEVKDSFWSPVLGDS